MILVGGHSERIWKHAGKPASNESQALTTSRKHTPVSWPIGRKGKPVW